MPSPSPARRTSIATGVPTRTRSFGLPVRLWGFPRDRWGTRRWVTSTSAPGAPYTRTFCASIARSRTGPSSKSLPSYTPFAPPGIGEGTSTSWGSSPRGRAQPHAPSLCPPRLCPAPGIRPRLRARLPRRAGRPSHQREGRRGAPSRGDVVFGRGDACHPHRTLLRHGPRPSMGADGTGVPRDRLRRRDSHPRPSLRPRRSVRRRRDRRVLAPPRSGGRRRSSAGPPSGRRRGDLLQLPSGPGAPTRARPRRRGVSRVRPRAGASEGPVRRHDDGVRGKPSRARRLSAGAPRAHGREVWAEAGLSQLRIAETEKYAHVTYFFSGGREEPFPGERRVLIPPQGRHVRPQAGDERLRGGRRAPGNSPEGPPTSSS